MNGWKQRTVTRQAFLSHSTPTQQLALIPARPTPIPVPTLQAHAAAKWRQGAPQTSLKPLNPRHKIPKYFPSYDPTPRRHRAFRRPLVAYFFQSHKFRPESRFSSFSPHFLVLPILCDKLPSSYPDRRRPESLGLGEPQLLGKISGRSPS